MSNINGYCPHCNADLDGELVVDTFINQGETREQATKWASHTAGYKEHGLANRWMRGVEWHYVRGDTGDEHECPDCKGKWKL